jgi:hypothetical protein
MKCEKCLGSNNLIKRNSSIDDKTGLNNVSGKKRIWIQNAVAHRLRKIFSVGFHVLTAASMGLMIEAVRTSETSVNFYQIARRNILEHWFGCGLVCDVV